MKSNHLQIVIISGSQGSGKSSLARLLSDEQTIETRQVYGGIIASKDSELFELPESQLTIWVDECTDPVRVAESIIKGNYRRGIICTNKPIEEFKMDLPGRTYRFIELTTEVISSKAAT